MPTCQKAAMRQENYIKTIEAAGCLFKPPFFMFFCKNQLFCRSFF